MMQRWQVLRVLSVALLALPTIVRGASKDKTLNSEFRTSDRCVACHNELQTSSGEDISIGFQWRASIMANSARDPYWQGSVRRESLDHPESQANIEDECSICHMPITHLTAKTEGQKAKIFANLPISSSDQEHRAAADGVSCSVCHQIERARLGTSESFNGNVAIASPKEGGSRLEYGPFVVDSGHRRVMESSTGGFLPAQGDQIRDSALCGSCHTLKTKALGPGGEDIGSLPEQVPYEEWLHSDYRDKRSCQSCHMPEVEEPVRVTALYGPPRVGMHRHEFIGGNFFLQRILNGHRDDLGVGALSPELSAAADRTTNFLQTQSARVSIRNLQTTATGLSLDVLVENLTGHKLPTAYPSRRAWLHVVVRDSNNRAVFESGALNPDGSIVGNDNDADPLRFEPYYREINSPEQVQIFEPILKDSQGKVTTGLLSAIGYLKDSRILPSGFDKKTAEPDISVVGEAADDPDFNDKGALSHYVINTGDAVGPFHVEVELWYQPIGFRWAHNLAPYKAMEPQRFVGYYEAAAQHSAIVMARAEAGR
jgi:cytochrome c551/c552